MFLGMDCQTEIYIGKRNFCLRRPPQLTASRRSPPWPVSARRVAFIYPLFLIYIKE